MTAGRAESVSLAAQSGLAQRANSRRPHGAFSYACQSSPLTLHRTFKFRAVIPATALWHNALSRTRSAVVR